MGNERIEKLKSLAYELGYEVGLKGHDEWTSWVYREKKKLLAHGGGNRYRQGCGGCL